MKRLLGLIFAAGLSLPVFAQHDAFPFGEPKVGAKLFEAKCAACHVRMFGEVGKAFVRESHKAKDAPTILAWVQRCNNANRLSLGREEEGHLAAYLNDAFYKFK